MGKNSNERKITIGDVEYNVDELSDNRKVQIAYLKILDVQMRKIKSKISVYQTARNSYVAAHKSDLE